MYNRIVLSFSALILILLFLFQFKGRINKREISVVSSPKIVLNSDMVINETALGDAWRLVDEQDIVGDPVKGTGEIPKSQWQIDWNKKDYYPISAVIDLGQNYKISNIFIFDGAGAGRIDIATGVPFDWNEPVSDDLMRYNIWKKKEINSETRYIRIKLYTQAGIPEIVVYGDPMGVDKTSTAEKRPGKARSSISMEHFIGLNAFIDDPLEKIQAVGFVREYHVWEWDEGDKKTYQGYPNNKNAFNPSYAGGGGWNFDAYYKQLSDKGIVVSTCIQESPSWLNVPSDAKPVPEGRNTESPSSYKEHADHMFQVAARYGSTKVDNSLLKLAQNQPRVSGLDYIRYYENWNEQDKDWKSRREYFSPYEYAAMTSADYDGHLGTIGKTYGIKNADKKSKLVMGGISALNLDYIKSIKFWADWNREGSIPFDVINVHHYSNDGGRQRSLGKVGISPEDDSLRQKLKKFVDYRDAFMPDKEIWITEFGYDTHKNSVQRAPAIGKYSQEEVQGIWLVRSYLAISAAGFDRAAMYMLRDTESKSGTQFNTSGLTSRKSEKHQPKPSWYYVFTLKNVLKGHVFSADYSTKAIMQYDFKTIDEKSGVLVVWLPTSKAAKIEAVDIEIPSKARTATLIKFEQNSTTGSREDLNLIQNSVNVDIEEMPIFIKYEY